jgi:hypothetical protein
MMACLLAKIRTNQEEMREVMKTNQAKMDAKTRWQSKGNEG